MIPVCESVHIQPAVSFGIRVHAVRHFLFVYQSLPWCGGAEMFEIRVATVKIIILSESEKNIYLHCWSLVDFKFRDSLLVYFFAHRNHNNNESHQQHFILYHRFDFMCCNTQQCK